MIKQEKANQIEISKNLYFQQYGDTVDGVYVNDRFLSIKTARELNSAEFTSFAKELYDLCMKTAPIREKIEAIAKEYEENLFSKSMAVVNEPEMDLD